MHRRDDIQRDNGPMTLAQSEAVAATLVDLGYQARAYGLPGWGWQVIVRGQHGMGPRFRYVITDAARLPRALEDLAAGQTGGDKQLEEGV